MRLNIFKSLEYCHSDEIISSFNDLQRDIYSIDKSRRRRFRQYKLEYINENWEIIKLPMRPYVQSSSINHVSGGICRYFKSIIVNIDEYLKYVVEEADVDRNISWQVNVQQYRIEANTKSVGTPVPEGIHRDGTAFTAILCVNRKNINGGISILYDLSKNEIYRDILKKGQGLLLNDRKLFHDVTQIEIADIIDGVGFRDVFVFGISEWNCGKYGPDFEREMTGEEGDLSKIPQD